MFVWALKFARNELQSLRAVAASKVTRMRQLTIDSPPEHRLHVVEAYAEHLDKLFQHTVHCPT